MEDIFRIQDEIAMAIAEKLKITLLEKEKEKIQTNPTLHTHAYDLYLKGRYYLNKRGPHIRTALGYFTEATAIDPDFSLPYSGLADAFSILAFYGSLPPTDAMPKARQHAKKAIELDPANAEAHTTLAFIAAFYDWNWEECKKLFNRVFEIKPRYAQAHYWHSYFLSFVEGKTKEGIEEAKKAADTLEPLEPISHHVLAITYIIAGDYEKAFESAQAAIDLDEKNFPGYRALGISLAGMERYDEAIEALKTCIQVSARHPWGLVELCWVYSLAGKNEEIAPLVDELEGRAATEFISGMFLAGASYFMKEYDQAIIYMEKAFEQKDGSLACIKMWPLCSFIRSDPRFQRFLERMKFPV